MIYLLNNNLCNDENLKIIVSFLKTIFTLIQIIIPVLLVIFGSIDLGKAVMAGDEKEIKSATTLLMKRAIAAVAVFLLVVLVRLVTGLVGGEDWRECWEHDFSSGDLASNSQYVEKINV